MFIIFPGNFIKGIQSYSAKSKPNKSLLGKSNNNNNNNTQAFSINHSLSGMLGDEVVSSAVLVRRPPEEGSGFLLSLCRDTEAETEIIGQNRNPGHGRLAARLFLVKASSCPRHIPAHHCHLPLLFSPLERATQMAASGGRV